jgi:hypothetical protein
MNRTAAYRSIWSHLVAIASIAIALTFYSTTAFSQATGYQSIKGVEFNDGSVIMGQIIQLNTDTVSIQALDGELYVRKFSDVKRFIKDTEEYKLKSTESREVQAQTSEPVALPAKRGYFALGGGSGGDAKCSNGRMEAGYYTVTDNVNYLLGIGAAVTFGRDQTPADLLDYPVPHSFYVNLGQKNKGEEWGFYAKFGFEPIHGSGLFLFGLGGFTMGQQIMLAQSLATGWYYTQSTTTNTYGLYGGGIGYYGALFPINVQLSYDNRMGTTGMIGFSW